MNCNTGSTCKPLHRRVSERASQIETAAVPQADNRFTLLPPPPSPPSTLLHAWLD
ncbi:hypothetical protein J6590_067372 [Homalodisca vitripennis]|nr:hypothetical protein J6590_067372 [Homalodisca vitripennis]